MKNFFSVHFPKNQEEPKIIDSTDEIRLFVGESGEGKEHFHFNVYIEKGELHFYFLENVTFITLANYHFIVKEIPEQE